ncbi:MAG: hypothetical protein Kow0059_08670 [Candidatus Sumerlaeia bacterium]
MTIMRNLRAQAGVALLTTLILLSVAVLLSVGLLRFTMEVQMVDEKRNDGIKAFYIAEAGVHEVVHYFNHPTDYTPDTTLFAYDETTNTFPSLAAALAGGEVTLDASFYPSFTAANGAFFGNVVSLSIIPPSASDPVASIGVIKSVGRTLTGVEKTVFLYLFPGSPAVEAPAAIISKASTYFNGDVKVHWGEVWSLAPTELENFRASKLRSYVDTSDPGWTKARTNNYFYRINGSTKYYMDGTVDGSHTEIPGLIDPYQGDSEFQGRFLQYQNLKFPAYDYQEYKSLALQRGEYYSTDASGNIYRNGIETTENQVDFNTEFGTATPGGDFRLVFIDTIDGQPPAADGSNLATISISGSSPHFRGLFYIAANVDTSGLGNPPTITALNPDGVSVDLSKIWIDGVLYVSGQMDVTGNPRIYGSMIVEREITGHGTPDVYYNYRLADGQYFPINGRVRVQLFKVQ